MNPPESGDTPNAEAMHNPYIRCARCIMLGRNGLEMATFRFVVMFGKIGLDRDKPLR
ncbi:hypothetical protein [Actibacterium sp. 188UL27-1]|uniref:hypothetical protein n=1 Tax=Actibacterium sp. 188UL27-1 TaxID=2786961 RepID=UPI00195618BA|nr:hypothetical protein [Actibacterium sp. 188UL27-1]MBM7069053.1 hypothetical protein [Actibacterium sp. 188UL27-1]